jgi:hypothetical protein
MRFYTPQQCQEWLAQRARVRPDQNKSLPAERFEYPNEAHRFFPIASSMLCGWGGYVLTEANYVNAFFSHDEYMDFFTSTPENLSELRPYFAKSEAPDHV